MSCMHVELGHWSAISTIGHFTGKGLLSSSLSEETFIRMLQVLSTTELKSLLSGPEVLASVPFPSFTIGINTAEASVVFQLEVIAFGREC